MVPYDLEYLKQKRSTRVHAVPSQLMTMGSGEDVLHRHKDTLRTACISALFTLRRKRTVDFSQSAP